MVLRGPLALILASLLVPLAPSGAQAQVARQVSGPPRLLVILSVDQMRQDYVERYGSQWTRGLKRLVERGARFTRASYPYPATVTCAGHATISTGTFPATHGMVLNQWFERELNRAVPCTHDPEAGLLTRAGPVEPPGHSARRLRAPALADELRVQRGDGPRVVALSQKARSAIMLGGRRPDLAGWFDRGRGWVSSTAFPDQWLAALHATEQRHPAEADYGKVWTRSLPPERYLFEDEGLGERKAGWTASFPHALESKSGRPDEAFYGLWETSPFSDEALGRLAMAMLDELRLGQREATDLLALSFSALDYVGHAFGPRSHEVQDVLVRLDAVVGSLLDALDQRVGAGRYVVVLTGDHGVSPIPEQMEAAGLDAGRIDTKALAERIEEALVPHLGPGPHVSALYYTEVYFTPGTYQKLLDTPAALVAALRTIERTPGVYRAVRGDELRDTPSRDPLVQAAAHGYVPDRSGDILILPRPYFITSTAVATHGTPYDYDARVPLILAGAALRPGEYLQPVTPADIAPTLAWFAGITLPRSDGRVLHEALVAEPASPLLCESKGTPAGPLP
jgi:predicted AlkP superfamily pyrophosphatase or phosphodiesterase